MDWWVNCCPSITEDSVQRFFNRFQFLFNFTTEKFVVIRDWRLGLVLRLLQLAIFTYVLYDVISQGSYLEQEVPKGVISPWAAVTGNQRRASIRKQQKDFNSGNLSYCTNSSQYDYEWNEVVYADFKCKLMDSLTIPIQGESKFFVTTYLRLDKLYFVDAGSNSCGTSLNSEIPTEAEDLGKYYGTCIFNSVEQTFPISPERIPLEILHSYYTSVVEKSGSAPETIISTPGYGSGGKKNFKEGANIKLTMKELLKLAGVDLDQRLDAQPNESNGVNEAARSTNTTSSDPYPMARISGVNIIMNFKYYVRSLAPSNYRVSSGPKAQDVLCIVELEPQYVWSVQGSDIQHRINAASDPFFVDPNNRTESGNGDIKGIQVDFQRNGVTLTFQVSGTIGRFSFFALVDALVSGAVLLSVAQLIVTYLALYALGLSSMLYSEFMREQVDWRKEYARFASQSLVAGAAFKEYDKNASWTLDRPEIFAYLCEVIKEESLEREKVACLTDFLMRQGEHDTEVSKGRLDEAADIKMSTINIAEWIDIFTEEKVKLSSLNRLIDKEYSDPKIKAMLLRLAEGRTVRGLSQAVSGDVIGGLEQGTGADDHLLELGDVR